MKPLKVTLMLLILGAVALLTFGCAADSFTYTYYVDGNGDVHEDFLLLYDKDADDASDVKQQAIAAMSNYVLAQDFGDYAKITDEVEGEVRLELTFPSMTDYYIALGYTGREPNDPLVPTEKGFIDRYEVKHASYLNENNVEYVRSLVSEEYSDFPLEQCDFYYTFGTTSKLTTSHGDVEEKDGVYYHTWKVNYGEDPNMVLTAYSPNGVIVLSIIISIFILSLAVIFVIIIINRKKKDKLRAAEVATEDGASGSNAATTE